MTPEVYLWCIRQCEIQHATTDADLAGMAKAWEYAKQVTEFRVWSLHLNDIVWLGYLVDPVANPHGQFRKGPAVFMDGGTSLPAHRIESQLMELLSSQDVLPPWFMYRELMYIHPFKDGNGRVGALVYNLLNGTIDNPIAAPPYK